MSGRPDRDARFDEELRRAARALVAEPLPNGVLDPAVGAALGDRRAGDAPGHGPGAGGVGGRVRARRALPGFAAASTAVAVLLIATAVALAPGAPSATGPSAEPSPTPVATTAPPSPALAALRSTGAIVVDMTRLGYTCGAGNPVESVGPGPDPVVRESAACVAPEDVGPFVAAVIVGETAEGRVAEVHAKADIVGDDTPAAREAVAFALAKAAAIAVDPAGAGDETGDWVFATVPTLESSSGDAVEFGDISVKVVRNATGGYLVIVHAG